ncbi:hypothetical protein BMS_0763 [Halobacteriovorax marinus SJ]|uniref:Uncharacterized protein n=1 Tax=Halobacteriovorax marinus (strain ATCC BAA-682 / DSM 15412 / SJ) TaxID=862908 RepID=E1X5V0_HALMS|nr:hypothetical protein [Halobacteriovorax marinus]CBW25667.1 hypothetical protein BMS_0763 [Halobacteriovorax marinus SJ]
MLIGKPAHSCKDFINQYLDNITFDQDYYRNRLRVHHKIMRLVNQKDYIMNHINFFKRQAKNLLKDFKTKEKYYDEVADCDLHRYNPFFFDIDNIVVTYDLDEDKNFTLMNAQHFISQLVGFKKWNELIKASESELELAKLLFDNQHKLSLDDWEWYISEAEYKNNITFSSVDRLEIFKMVFLKDGNFATMPNDFRLTS